MVYPPDWIPGVGWPESPTARMVPWDGKQEARPRKLSVTERYWVSCNRFSVAVSVENGKITEAAPMVQKFVGQPLANLERWARGLGGYELVQMVDVGGKTEAVERKPVAVERKAEQRVLLSVGGHD